MPARARFRKNPYASDIPTPWGLPALFIALIILSGFAVGLDLSSTHEAGPTGFVVKNLNLEFNDSGEYDNPSLLHAVMDASSPPGFENVSHMISSNFLAFQPLPASVKMGDGTFNMKFMKVFPIHIDVDEVRIENNANAGQCRVVEAGFNTVGPANLLIVNATGCKDNFYEKNGDVFVYDVTVDYVMDVGDVKTRQINRGQIRLW
jgi:hypothetical protein